MLSPLQVPKQPIQQAECGDRSYESPQAYKRRLCLQTSHEQIQRYAQAPTSFGSGDRHYEKALALGLFLVLVAGLCCFEQSCHNIPQCHGTLDLAGSRTFLPVREWSRPALAWSQRELLIKSEWPARCPTSNQMPAYHWYPRSSQKPPRPSAIWSKLVTASIFMMYLAIL